MSNHNEKIFIWLLAFGALESVHVQAAVATQTKVVYAGVNNGGVVFVQLENAINEQGCVGNQLVIPADNEIREKYFQLH